MLFLAVPGDGFCFSCLYQNLVNSWNHPLLIQPNVRCYICFHCREIYCPRGRVWGGSSSLNAMVYIRGHAFDYDRWQVEGCDGWSYADCLPYFKKAQNHYLGKLSYFILTVPCTGLVQNLKILKVLEFGNKISRP
jgi:choline dehydrogenase-like flavoprotein